MRVQGECFDKYTEGKRNTNLGNVCKLCRLFGVSKAENDPSVYITSKRNI